MLQAFLLHHYTVFPFSLPKKNQTPSPRTVAGFTADCSQYYPLLYTGHWSWSWGSQARGCARVVKLITVLMIWWSEYRLINKSPTCLPHQTCFIKLFISLSLCKIFIPVNISFKCESLWSNDNKRLEGDQCRTHYSAPQRLGFNNQKIDPLSWT